jgi:hypothetical protein
MLKKRLTRSLVRNLALAEMLLTSMLVVELALLSCDTGMVARSSSGSLSMVSGDYLNEHELAHERGCDGSSRGDGGPWSCF